MKNKLLALCLALALGVSVPANGQENKSERQRWEYAQLVFNPRYIEKPYSWRTGTERIEELNDRQLVQRIKHLEREPAPHEYFLLEVIGEQGWELTGVSNSQTGATFYIFKRPAQVKTEAGR